MRQLPNPRRLYAFEDEPAPSLLDYQRQYARAGVGGALVFEGTLVLFFALLERGVLLLGFIDGLDEVVGCVGLLSGVFLAFIGYLIGSAIGAALYARALADYHRRHPTASPERIV